MRNLRAIAVQGFGFGLMAVATQGFLVSASQPQAPFFANDDDTAQSERTRFIRAQNRHLIQLVVGFVTTGELDG